MKKITAILLCLCLALSFCACGKDDPVDPIENNQGTENNPPGISDPFSAKYVQTDGYGLVEMNRLPSCAADLENVYLGEEYTAAALIVAALSYYETDPEKCFEMIDYLMGPESISSFDKSFIKEQFSQYPYVARSYMDGAEPSNDYKVDSISYRITETPYSRDEAGYVKLYFQSGGADSVRGVTLRYKESTDQWFLFSDSYKGLLAGIRQPESGDKWK